MCQQNDFICSNCKFESYFGVKELKLLMKNFGLDRKVITEFTVDDILKVTFCAKCYKEGFPHPVWTSIKKSQLSSISLPPFG